jgi:pantetheine-phosphate adenylyltransferase
LFSVEERLAMLREATASYPYVEVVSFSGLTVDLAKKRKARFLLRGIRSVADFEYESEMAAANRQMGGIETLLLFGLSPHISSSLVREIAYFGGPLEGFVPPGVEALLKSKFTARK